MRSLSRYLRMVSILVAAVAVGPAGATRNFEQGEIQARIAVQNTFHHDAVRNIDWVQERNEFRFDLKYDLLRPGAVVLGIDKAKFNLLYRGRYDSVYDARDSYRRRGYDRDDFRFPEGKIPRELFFDVGFAGPLKPFSIRIGRQQVVWGEADLFRSIDVVNPLRIDQNGLVGEDFADYREPLWIAKFLYDIGQLGPVADAGLEFLYSPNGRSTSDRPVIYGETWRIGVDQNNVLDGFNRSTLLPFQQVRAPWELGRVGARKTDSPDQAVFADGSKSDFIYQINTDIPNETLSFDASMAGLRFIGKTYGGFDFTLNYLFKRTDAAGTALVFEDLFDPSQPGTGAIQPAVLQRAIAATFGTPDSDGNGITDGQEQQIRDCINKKSPELILTSVRGTGNPSTGCLTIPEWHPWTHIVGGTLTYNDYNMTGLVFRLEESFSTKEPRNARYPTTPARPFPPDERDFATHGMRTTQVWRSMVGFDYLRSIYPLLGRRSPQPFRSLLSDQWFFTFQFLNEYYAHADNQTALITSATDRMMTWNPVLTAAASGYFLGDRFRPYLAAAYDINVDFPLFLVQADFHLAQRWSLRLGEIIYAGSKNAESFLGLHKYADRDNLYVRIIYWIL